MENFESKISATEKSLKNIRGIFERENVSAKIQDLEKISLKENFWKDKNLVKKTVKQKKIFENILNFYTKSLKNLTI